MGSPTRIFSFVAIFVVILVLTIFIGQGTSNYGDRKFAEGIDSGAMLIINDLVAGRNISYKALDGKEYKIELFTESAQWYKHEEKDTICSTCHKYSTQYLQKGG